jgi:hypothetical protein
MFTSHHSKKRSTLMASQWSSWNKCTTFTTNFILKSTDLRQLCNRPPLLVTLDLRKMSKIACSSTLKIILMPLKMLSFPKATMMQPGTKCLMLTKRKLIKIQIKHGTKSSINTRELMRRMMRNCHLRRLVNSSKITLLMVQMNTCARSKRMYQIISTTRAKNFK